MTDWAGERLGLHFLPARRSLAGNGSIELFNSRVRNECLNINIFWALTQASVILTMEGGLQAAPTT